MQLTRRELLVASAGALLLPRIARAESALSSAARAALDASPLLYVCALKRDGSESRCQAEVWFVRDGDDALVVTSAKAWRAQAVRQGLTRARLWVGDAGVWDPRERKYAALPSYLASASLDTAPAQHDHALSLFGSKYTREWGSWGPRFKNGLADGTRVLLRYRAAAA